MKTHKNFMTQQKIQPPTFFIHSTPKTSLLRPSNHIFAYESWLDHDHTLFWYTFQDKKEKPKKIAQDTAFESVTDGHKGVARERSKLNENTNLIGDLWCRKHFFALSINRSGNSWTPNYRFTFNNFAATWPEKKEQIIRWWSLNCEKFLIYLFK